MATIQPEAPSQIIPTPTYAQTSPTNESILSPTDAAAAQQVILAGSVRNLSSGSIPSGSEVVLQGFEGMQMISTVSTTISADGSFTFPEVSWSEGQVFMATTEYLGILYGSEVIHFEDLASGVPPVLTIDIYEKTTDLSAVSADRAHIFINYLSADRLRVIIYLLVSNLGDRVVTGSGPDDPVLTFKLPEEAANLEFEEGGSSGRYLETQGGFEDLLSIRPGIQQHEILFAFELPYTGRRKIDLTFPLKVATTTIVAPADGVKLKGNQLQAGGEQQTDTGVMQIFNVQELSAGDTLELNLSGRPQGIRSGTENSMLGTAIGLGIFAVVLVLGGFWLNHRTKKRMAGVHPSGKAAPFSQETLLDKIVMLDEAFETGRLSQDEYEERRAELKEKLRELREKGEESKDERG